MHNIQMRKRAIDLVESDKYGLLIDHAYYAIPILRLSIVESDCVPLMGTDGNKLFINHLPESPIFTYRPAQRRFVLCHESCHLLGGHHFRQDGRELLGWNISGDLNINAGLIKLAAKPGSNLEPPDGILLEPELVDSQGKPLSPEKIYVIKGYGKKPEPNPDQGESGESDNDESDEDSDGSPGDTNNNESTDDSSENGANTNPQNDESENSGQSSPAESDPSIPPENGSDSDSDQSDTDSQNSDQLEGESEPAPNTGGCGAIMPADSSETGDDSTQENTPESWAITTAQAVAVAKSQGYDSGDLTELFGDYLNPRQNWRRQLMRFFTATTKDDYSMRKLNRKFLGLGLCAAGQISDGSGEYVVALDVSGSMTGEIPKCLDHMNMIFEQIQPEKVHVVYVDSKIRIVDTFRKGERLTLRQFVAGGTDFRPLFDWIAEKRIRPEAVVFFTDCYGAWPDKPPRYPVLVATTERVDTLPASCKPPKRFKVVDVTD